MSKYKPSSWLMLALGKIIPMRFLRHFIDVDRREHVAIEEIKILSDEILSSPCSKHTSKLRSKAREAAKEVLNGSH